MKTILETLAADAQRRVAEKKAVVPADAMKERALALPRDTGFPFEKALAAGDLAFICECKKASPSKGLIAPDYRPLQIAEDYEAAGAAALSVLTEPTRFLGRDDDLRDIAATVCLPCLRKDFTVDAYMLYEAKLLGASAVLLICALLDTTRLSLYIDICDLLGLSALVEAHTGEEIQSAVAAGARVIGVNNRDLRNFTVDIDTSRRLRAQVPDGIHFVAESGIRTADDIRALRSAGVHGVLIGQALMTAPDKKAALARLRGAR